MSAGAINEGILIDPAYASRIRAKLRRYAFGQVRGNLPQIFQHPCTCPVQICAILENHVDIAVAEKRKAAYGAGAGHCQHRRRNRIGDLILDDLRRLTGIGVRTITCTSDRSGMASTGVERMAQTPTTPIMIASASMITRLAIEAWMMARIIRLPHL